MILVTHFMEEAERLCDRVALLHHGRVIAIDTPAALAAGASAGQRISFRPSAELDLDAMRELPEVRDVRRHGDRIVVEGSGDLVAAVIGALVRAGVIPEQTRIEQSTLDDAFVALTADADAVAAEFADSDPRGVPMTAIAAAPARTRPGGFRRLLATELKLFLREPLLLFWGLAVPGRPAVVLGIAGPSKPQHSLGGVKLIVAYTPVVMMFTLTILALSALPAALASYRDKGYLRRLSTTPIGAVRLLAAQMIDQPRARRERGDPDRARQPLRVLGGAPAPARRLRAGDRC